jgi:Tol biopolymer transport system component
MKQFTVAISLCVAFSVLVNAGQRKIAFARGKNIFVADADGTHSRKIAEGALPEISPDGRGVAFNTEGDAKNRPGPERHIAIADVANGNIYQIDLDGNVLKKWELAKILTDASMNGGDRLSVSPDGKALLMDVDCGSQHERKNWDGPQPAIEKLDLSADKAVRVTGKDDLSGNHFG